MGLSTSRDGILALPLAVVQFFDIKGTILTGEGRGIPMLRWLPEDVSPYGPGIDSLFYFIYYITAAAFILVTSLMVIFRFMYRHREGLRATYTHGNTALNSSGL